MPPFVGGRRCRNHPDLVAVGVKTLEFQVFSRRARIEADLDRHITFGFEPGDFLSFTVAQVGGHAGMDGDRDPADLLTVRGQGQEAA